MSILQVMMWLTRLINRSQLESTAALTEISGACPKNVWYVFITSISLLSFSLKTVLTISQQIKGDATVGKCVDSWEATGVAARSLEVKSRGTGDTAIV